ncbi:VOC family protein [Micromonospora sp. KC606]|uniref:VOC family protein n=1 Tax=Micromonospora sp. KC606 TaxID=2530379 RepID=UPI00140457B7|nr:VOC family protein [Micromonospora sp. KC606]
MPMGLRVEIFSADPDRSSRFYERVLGFAIEDRQVTDGRRYVAIRRDDVRIGIGEGGVDVPREVRAVPAGTEIVLEVDDVRRELASVATAGWPLESQLRRQPWGLEDFRLFDPDGYFLRITARHPSPNES